mgnify:FL=1
MLRQAKYILISTPKLNTLMSEKNIVFKRALELAENLIESVSPRPPVASIITHDGKIIGEGVTTNSPLKHAEINAIDKAKDKIQSFEESTLYSTLEPCFHKGNTDPCVDKIIESGIKNVVIGSVDPNPKVNKKSINKLKNNNVNVELISNNDLKKRSDKLIEPFNMYIKNSLPFVTVKMAISLDGKIATKTGDSKWISSEKSREIVQDMRSKSDAIIIGSKTLEIDKPSLNARNKDKQPKIKAIIKSNPKNISEFESLLKDNSSEIIIYCNKIPSKNQKWENFTFVQVNSENGKLDLENILRDLASRDCINVLMEGGGKLLGSLIDLNLVNKVRLFISPMLIGGESSTDSIGGDGIEFISQSKKITDIEVKIIESDIMVTGTIKEHV